MYEQLLIFVQADFLFRTSAFLPEPSGLQGPHVGDRRRLVQREGQPALHSAGNFDSQVQGLVASHQKLQEMQSRLLALATANAASQEQTQQQLDQLFKHLGVVQDPGATRGQELIQEQGPDGEGHGAFRGDGNGMLDGRTSGVCALCIDSAGGSDEGGKGQRRGASVVTSVCDTCGDLCHECARMHGRMRTFLEHQVTPLPGASPPGLKRPRRMQRDSSAATLAWRHEGRQNGLSPERPLYASNVSVSGVHRLYLPQKQGMSE